MFGLFEYKNESDLPCGFRMDEVVGYVTNYEMRVYMKHDPSPYSLVKENGNRFIKEYKEWYDTMCVSHTSLDKK